MTQIEKGGTEKVVATRKMLAALLLLRTDVRKKTSVQADLTELHRSEKGKLKRAVVQ